MPSLVQRARSVAASVTRSIRSAARRLGSLFTRRRSATPGLRRRPTGAVTAEEYIAAVPNRAPSPRPRTPSPPRARTPSPPRPTANNRAREARLQRLANPRTYNLPRPPVSARAPRPASVPGGIAGPEGNTARRRVIAAREAAAAAASRAAEQAAEQAAIASQRAVLEETIDGISRLTPRNFKRLVREITFAAFIGLHPAIHEAIVVRVSSDLNHDEFMMIRPDVRRLMSERAERLGLPLP